MEEHVPLCANCGADSSTEFCPRCGEEKLARERLRIPVFLKRAVEEVSDFEHSKLLRTLKLLIFRPGFLTTEYLRGRRKSFVGPVKIYLAVFAFSFLLYSIKGPTSVYDVRTFVTFDRTGGWQTQVDKLVAMTHLTEPVLLDEINARWRRYLNLTQAIYPVSIALFLQILYFRTRRYYAEHLIFALHFSAIASGINIVMWPLYAITGIRLDTAYYVSTFALLLFIFAWLVIASRRVYGASWLASTIKTALIETGYFAVGIFITLSTLAFAVFTLVRSR